MYSNRTKQNLNDKTKLRLKILVKKKNLLKEEMKGRKN